MSALPLDQTLRKNDLAAYIANCHLEPCDTNRSLTTSIRTRAPQVTSGFFSHLPSVPFQDEPGLRRKLNHPITPFGTFISAATGSSSFGQPEPCELPLPSPLSFHHETQHPPTSMLAYLRDTCPPPVVQKHIPSTPNGLQYRQRFRFGTLLCRCDTQ